MFDFVFLACMLAASPTDSHAYIHIAIHAAMVQTHGHVLNSSTFAWLTAT
jgi:hypothetical protein